MFPIKDNIPASRFPVVTLGLIIINSLCFVYEWRLGVEIDSFLVDYGFVPARYIALQAENFLDFSRFLPVFTSMFLHGGVLHLIFNMWMLWIFGDNVEDAMGRRRFLVFYLLCGVASVSIQGLFSTGSMVPLVGASGAIAGVLGAYFLLYPRAKITTVVPIFIFFYMVDIPAFIFLGFWFAIQFVRGYFDALVVGGQVGGGVAWWAHVGGFACGILSVHLFKKKKRMTQIVLADRAK